MGTPDNNSNIKEAKVKGKMEQQKPQMQYHQNNPAFTPRPKFVGACRALKGQTFSGHQTNNFKGTLYNIKIYVGANYGQEMGMTVKA